MNNLSGNKKLSKTQLGGFLSFGHSHFLEKSVTSTTKKQKKNY